MHSGQAANVNTTPQFHQQTWMKTGEAATVLPYFTRGETQKSLDCKGTSASFSYLVQIVSYISTKRDTI